MLANLFSVTIEMTYVNILTKTIQIMNIIFDIIIIFFFMRIYYDLDLT